MPSVGPLGRSRDRARVAIESMGRRVAVASSDAASRRGRIPSWAPRLAEFAAVIVLGVGLAKIVGAWFYPLPVSNMPVAASAPAPMSPVVVVNPFRKPLIEASNAVDASSDVIDAADTSLNLTLYGTWVDRENASATIGQGDGGQKVYAIGDEICCGAKLDKVFATHVLINRGGAIEALRLANKFEGAAASEPSPALAASPAPVADFSTVVAIVPTQAPNGKLEITISPAGDPERFASYGLQEGDVIVSVNGQAAPDSGEKIQSFLQSLRGASSYRVVVRRSGSNVTIDFAPPLAARGQEG